MSKRFFEVNKIHASFTDGEIEGNCSSGCFQRIALRYNNSSFVGDRRPKSVPLAHTFLTMALSLNGLGRNCVGGEAANLNRDGSTKPPVTSGIFYLNSFLHSFLLCVTICRKSAV